MVLSVAGAVMNCIRIRCGQQTKGCSVRRNVVRTKLELKLYNQEYYKKNRARLKRYGRRYYKNNRAKCIAAIKKYNEEHKEEISFKRKVKYHSRRPYTLLKKTKEYKKIIRVIAKKSI